MWGGCGLRNVGGVYRVPVRAPESCHCRSVLHTYLHTYRLQYSVPRYVRALDVAFACRREFLDHGSEYLVTAMDA